MLKYYSFRPAINYVTITERPKLSEKRLIFLHSIRMSGKNIIFDDKNI